MLVVFAYHKLVHYMYHIAHVFVVGVIFDEIGVWDNWRTSRKSEIRIVAPKRRFEVQPMLAA